jgi:integrase
VLSDDPNLSKLTNVEFDSLVWEIWKNFDIGSSGPQVTLLRLLSCHYFRRPTQFSQLKIGDIYLDSREDISKICAPRIFFPGAKDRFSEDNFRGSKFEYRPLPDHFIDLVRLQIHDVKNSFERLFEVNLNEDEYKKLPLFTTEHQIVHASEVLRDHFKIDPVSNLDHEIFHLTSVIIGDIIDWSSNSAIKRTADHCATKAPISERTGQDISVNATRMRHTGAFKLARRGVSKSLLSYIMGHTNAKSLNAYYKDPAEEARVLDEAMKGSLSQLHMAFTGKLLNADEELKVISESPDSILEHYSKQSLSSVGNCGKHSFCSTQTIPIPCYRCNSFQPFVGANHQQVLDALLERQRQENEAAKFGSPKNLLNPVDLSSDISCVLNVIAQCEAYKKNILGEGDE